MITGKTPNGFNISIKKRVIHSMDMTRRLASMDENTPVKDFIDMFERLLGKEQFDRLMEHCDESATDEKYGDDIFQEEAAYIFELLDEDEDVKN